MISRFFLKNILYILFYTTVFPALFFFTASAVKAYKHEEVKKNIKWGDQTGQYIKSMKTANINQYSTDKTESKNFISKLQAIESIFSKHPLLTSPQGFNARASIWIPELEKSPYLPSGAGAPFKGRFQLSVHEFYDSGQGIPVESGNSSGSIIIRLNTPEDVFQSMRIYVEGYGSNIYYQPKKIGTFYGYPRLNDTYDIVFINASKKSPWVPVSAEEYINISIKRLERVRDSQMKALDKTAVSPKEIVDEGKAERRRAFDEAYALLKKTDPAAALAAKKEFEEAEKRFAEEAAGHNITGDEIRSTEAGMYRQQLEKLKQELARLSAREKKAPAFFVAESEEHPSGLGNGSEENAKPVVRMNPDYFNDGRPPSAIRCMTITFNAHGQPHPPDYDWTDSPASMEAYIIFNLYESIDWKSVTAFAGK